MEESTALTICAIAMLASAAVSAVLSYFLVTKRPRDRRERCVAQTTGVVEGPSHFYSCNIRVPLVRYEVEGETYKIAGPRFSGNTNVFLTVGGADILRSSSNIEPFGELPAVVKAKGGYAAAQADMDARYPAGKTVPVFYDPERPKRAFVERDAPIPKFAAWILYGTSALVGILGVVFLIISANV